MFRFNKSGYILVSLALWLPVSSFARDYLEVSFDALTREYCHIVHFPSGWQMPTFATGTNGNRVLISKFDFEGGDYEFRIAGLSTTAFLVRGFERASIGRRQYTTNLYLLDLSNPKAVARLATEEEWNSGTVVPFKRNDVWRARGEDTRKKAATFDGRQFPKTGDHWSLDATRLSPDPSMLVLQSWSGSLGGGSSDVPGMISPRIDFRRNRGRLFFDVFNTTTAKKLITISTRFVQIRPDEAFGLTGWVTERYFIVPLDEPRARCLVCDLGKKR